jgi:DNA primase
LNSSGDASRSKECNAQRLLRPLEVINPYVEYLTYPADRLIHRREQKKYLALINAIALLRQHQREIRRAASGNAEIECVEVTLDDIALAGELAREVLGRNLDELAAPVRGMYHELQRLYARRADELGCPVGEVQLSRREIRDATGWSDWQVRAYCKQLVEMEYLYPVRGANGKRYVYALAWRGRTDDAETAMLDGLVDVEQLKARLKETA